jgi:uncharacterized protein YegL
MSRIQESGGGDLAEDVVGALHRATKWDWKSRIRFLVLIGDAPGHTADLHSFADKDDHFSSHPSGLVSGRNYVFPQLNFNKIIFGQVTESVIQEIAEKDIGFFYCRINEYATKQMENKFREHYSANEKGRTLHAVNLIQADDLPTNPFKEGTASSGAYHHVFCLDESGSMTGQPWNELLNAYRNYIKCRQVDAADLQGAGDSVSVVQFSSSARITYSKRSVVDAELALTMQSGGTNFGPALDQALHCLKQTSPNEIPVLLFMSDGGGSGGMEGMHRVKSALSSHDNFKVYTVGFGAGASADTLREMADVFGTNGQYKYANVGELSTVFAGIAKGCKKASAEMQRLVGNQISEQISDKIQLDWL